MVTLAAVGGRPRDERIDAALFDAATELISEKGFSAVTIDEVTRRAGTTKPAFYRRFSHLTDLIPGIIERRHGTFPGVNTGSFEADLLAFQTHYAQILNDVFVRNSIAGWLSYLASHPDEAHTFTRGFLRQRYLVVREIIQRAAERGEIHKETRTRLVMDSLDGPLFIRAILPGVGLIDETVKHDSVHAAITAASNPACRLGADPLTPA